MNISILSYGCAANRADSEIMASLLFEEGFNVSFDEEEDTDIFLVNTCIVKGPTEEKIMKKLMDFHAQKAKVVVSGCLPQAYPKITKDLPDFVFLGNNVFDITGVVKKYAKGEKTNNIRLDKREKAGYPKYRKDRNVEVIPIAQGCLGSCSYCATRLARGGLVSYPVDSVVKSVKRAVGEGVKEVWLTSQDNGCYGYDLKPKKNLVDLLKEVLSVPGDFRIRVGMMNPTHLLDFLDDLVALYKNNKKIKPFLHIPVQSGSDKVLRDMNRYYTAADFRKIVKKFRDGLDLTISTDIIVGFPTETREDFEKTLTLLKETKPNVLNVSRYWVRRGTKAAEMEQLPVEVIKERGKEASMLFRELKNKQEDEMGYKQIFIS